MHCLNEERSHTHTHTHRHTQKMLFLLQRRLEQPQLAAVFNTQQITADLSVWPVSASAACPWCFFFSDLTFILPQPFIPRHKDPEGNIQQYQTSDDIFPWMTPPPYPPPPRPWLAHNTWVGDSSPTQSLGDLCGHRQTPQSCSKLRAECAALLGHGTQQKAC